MRTSRGLTLLELLTSMAIMGVVLLGVSSAWQAANRYRTGARASREEHERSIRFEAMVTRLLKSAYLTSTATDTASYFVTLDQDAASSTPAPGIVFTSTGTRTPASYLAADDILESLNDRYGPQGGITELSLSLSAIGETNGKSGLFLRQQRPADSDFEQGGFESVLDESVESLGFEFFDGTQWTNVWDTLEGQRRLPAAVKVIYKLGDDRDRSFIVSIPSSDVTSVNPLTAPEVEQ